MGKYTEGIIFRCDKEFREKLDERAKKEGKTISAFIRDAVKNGVLIPMPPVDYRAKAQRFHVLGERINEVAREANATGWIDKAAYDAVVAEVLDEMREIKDITLAWRVEIHG